MPVALSAFHVSQNTRKKLASYHGALVFTRDGRSRMIRRINISGFWGGTLGRRLISALSGVRKVVVQFDDVPIDLEEFKSLIQKCISIDSKKNEPYLPQSESLDSVLRRVRVSKSFGEVFDSINIPLADNCLDVL